MSNAERHPLKVSNDATSQHFRRSSRRFAPHDDGLDCFIPSPPWRQSFHQLFAILFSAVASTG